MYEICILSKPDEFTRMVYYEMHNAPIPDNIRWVGYSEYSDCDAVEPDFTSHGKKVVLNKDEQNHLREELDIDDSNRFVVAVIERTSDVTTGCIGTIKTTDPSKASDDLISLSDGIAGCNKIPEFLGQYLKNKRYLGHTEKTISQNRLELLSLIPGLSLYVIGQKTKALIFAGTFVLLLCISIWMTYNYENGCFIAFLMLFDSYLMTMFECAYICDGNPWDISNCRVTITFIMIPLFVIVYSLLFNSLPSLIFIPIAVAILIYSLLTIFKIRKRKPLMGIEIIKLN